MIIAWIFAGHQVGGAFAAFGAGAVRSVTGDYLLAFLTSGLACLLASLLCCASPAPSPRSSRPGDERSIAQTLGRGGKLAAG